MERVEAIILKSTPYLEEQRIVRVFSARQGALSLITSPDGFRKKTQHTLSCLQVSEVVFRRSARGDLHRMISCQPADTPSQLHYDVRKMTIAQLWGEVLCQVLSHEQQNDSLYDFLRHSIAYLERSENDTANFNLQFLFRLCGMMGFRIDTDTYMEEALFDLRDGRFYPPGDNVASHRIGPHASRVIHRLCSSPTGAIADIPLNRESRSTLLDIALHFLGYHLNLDLHSRALGVIREMFR